MSDNDWMSLVLLVVIIATVVMHEIERHSMKRENDRLREEIARLRRG